MSAQCKLVLVTANPAPHSPCKALAELIAARIDGLVQVSERVHVEVALLAPEFAAARPRREWPPRLEAAIKHIEQADLLVVSTPVSRGSYTGFFKHVFDLVDDAALSSVPVALAATGDRPHHYLVVEHHLRPLFGFFQAFTLPTAVYATDSDFDCGVLRNPMIQGRIDMVATEAALTLGVRARHEQQQQHL